MRLELGGGLAGKRVALAGIGIELELGLHGVEGVGRAGGVGG